MTASFETMTKFGLSFVMRGPGSNDINAQAEGKVVQLTRRKLEEILGRHMLQAVDVLLKKMITLFY